LYSAIVVEHEKVADAALRQLSVRLGNRIRSRLDALLADGNDDLLALFQA